MDIYRKDIFRFEGLDYRSLSEVKTHVENKLGTVIDLMGAELTPKQKLVILKIKSFYVIILL